MGDLSGYRPLSFGERRYNRDGSHSTEITVTVDMPDGSIALIPSLWRDPNGNFVEMSPDQAKMAATQYEKNALSRFPRFKSYREADAFAMRRSEGGGALQSPLAKFGLWGN